MRTGNRRSASIIISFELAAIMFLVRSPEESYGGPDMSSRLGM
jgi:hypothetical protein